MAIKIETEKFVKGGEPYRRILSITGMLRKEELPQKYLDGSPKFYLRTGDAGVDYVWFDTCIPDLKVGGVVSEPSFQGMVEYMCKAARRLYQVNQQIRELERTWQGCEVVVV